MEKLMELLNEYDSGWEYDDYYGPFQYGQDSDAYHLCKYQLVSKEYGFIKWLVEENKIDKSKYERILDRIEYYNQSEEEQEIHYYSDVDSLLMLLSISDTPIKDLISYLK